MCWPELSLLSASPWCRCARLGWTVSDRACSRPDHVMPIRTVCQSATWPRDHVASWLRSHVVTWLRGYAERLSWSLSRRPYCLSWRGWKGSLLLSMHEQTTRPVGQPQAKTHAHYRRPTAEGPTGLVVKPNPFCAIVLTSHGHPLGRIIRTLTASSRALTSVGKALASIV